MPLFLIFLTLPLMEIALFIMAGKEFGILQTLFLLIVATVAGAIILKIQGVSTLHKIYQAMQSDTVPVQEIFDGLCLAVCGFFLVLPGFFTDLLAFLLLIPALRRYLRQSMIGRFGFEEARAAGQSGVIEGEYTRVEEERISLENRAPKD